MQLKAASNFMLGSQAMQDPKSTTITQLSKNSGAARSVDDVKYALRNVSYHINNLKHY